ncbi:MAG: hypothetical protein Q4C54_01755 [Clostridia bacterium]|nr:hypothetical protein [Clostridia bacterium]
MDDFRTAVNTSMDKMYQADQAAVGKLARTSDSIAQSTDRLAGSYQYFVSSIVDGFSRALGTFHISVNDMMAELSRQIEALPKSGTSGDAVKELSRIQQLLASMEKTLTASREEA